jgi:hypothetical protein
VEVVLVAVTNATRVIDVRNIWEDALWIVAAVEAYCSRVSGSHPALACSVPQRSQKMSQKKDSRHSTPKRHSPLIWGGVVLAVVMALWIGGVIAVRGHGSPADVVPSEGTSVVVEKTDDLSDRLGRLRTFPRWKVTEGGSLAGYIYTFPLDVSSPSMLDRLLLAPRSMEFAVYVDNQYTIRAMRQLSPRRPQSTTAFTAQYVGVDLYQVLGTNDQGTLAAGGDLAGPGHQLMRTLLGSVYLADFGEYAFSSRA